MSARLLSASKPIAAMLRGEIAVMTDYERQGILAEFFGAIDDAEKDAAAAEEQWAAIDAAEIARSRRDMLAPYGLPRPPRRR